MRRFSILPSIVVSLFAFAATAGDRPVEIVDGDTLDIGETRYRLHGIDAPEKAQKCSALGRTWPCGRAATDRLAALTAGRDVRCERIEDDGRGRIVARCFADGDDLSQAMVEAGLAWAFVKYSRDYVANEDRARVARRGVWRAPTEPPWDFRAKRWRVAAQEAPEGCAIKGNISERGRIYHAPWSASYKRTKITLSKGERWFCSEEEALAAGWRAPKR